MFFGIGNGRLFDEYERFPFIDVQPFVKRIFDAYGSKRMLWGADLTRLTCSYRECLDQFRTGLDFLSPQDREMILGKALEVALNGPELPVTNVRSQY